MVASQDTYAEDTGRSAAEKLYFAKQAAELGDRVRAYELSREATQLEPDNVDAWLYRAAAAKHAKQRLSCLSKALNLAPENLQAQHRMYQALNRYLNRDPFLRYLDETDVQYRMVTGAGRVIIVTKDHAAVVPYPASEYPELRLAYRWLSYALVGLLSAGIATLVCAPLAAAHACRSSQVASTRVQRRESILAMIYAGALWLVGLLFSILFLLHF